MAAGVTLLPDNLDLLRRRLNELARQFLTPEQLQPNLRLDAEVSLSELTLERVRELALLQQTGIGNPPVQLFTRRVTSARPLQRMGTNGKHARLWIGQGRTVIPAVLWSPGESPLPNGTFDLAFVPQINEFKGNTSVQLRILDWRPSA